MSGEGLINDQVKKVINQLKVQHIDRVCGSVAEEARIVEISSVSSQVHEWLLGEVVGTWVLVLGVLFPGQ